MQDAEDVIEEVSEEDELLEDEVEEDAEELEALKIGVDDSSEVQADGLI